MRDINSLGIFQLIGQPISTLSLHPEFHLKGQRPKQNQYVIPQEVSSVTSINQFIDIIKIIQLHINYTEID
jgi:hypothetical protein